MRCGLDVVWISKWNINLFLIHGKEELFGKFLSISHCVNLRSVHFSFCVVFSKDLILELMFQDWIQSLNSTVWLLVCSSVIKLAVFQLEESSRDWEVSNIQLQEGHYLTNVAMVNPSTLLNSDIWMLKWTVKSRPTCPLGLRVKVQRGFQRYKPTLRGCVSPLGYLPPGGFQSIGSEERWNCGDLWGATNL